jgi:drug/metabolite transporter (DMT)-like permease
VTVIPSTERVQQPIWGAMCMGASVLCFTANALLLKYLSSSADVSAWVSLAYRAVVGLVIIRVVFGRSGSVDFRRAATSRMLIARGMIGVLGTAAYYFTIPPLGPGKATLISNTFVVISALMAVWFLKEKLTGPKLVGNLIAIVGLAMLIGVSPNELAVVSGYELLALFGAIAGAIAVLIIRQLTLTETSATIYASQCFFVLLVSLIPAIVVWPSLSLHQFGLLLLASTCASFGQLAMTDGFRHLTVAVGGTFQILVPVLIAIGGVTMFSETFTTTQILGAVLILVGCYAAVVGK